MKKSIKILLIVIACIFGITLVAGGISHLLIRNTTDAEEYEMGDDTLLSIKSVVGKRDIVGISTGIYDGVKTKSMEYRSSSVQEDLMTYVQYLRDEGGFILVRDMDLTQIPSSVYLGKTSVDPGMLVMLTIDYDAFGYTLTLQKGEGTLTTY